MQKIVVDVYGADAGITPIVKGVAKALKNDEDFFPILVGPQKEIAAILAESGISENKFEIINTENYITNDDLPTCIFGGRDDSSMALSYERLKKDDECCGMLSAGNTGALLVGSICRLGLLPGLKFPALSSALPCGPENMICLVDCGANMDCTASDLARFARMGSVFSKSFCGIENPRVGLMSVGREKQKGTDLTREAYEKINQLPINFVGNLEGSDIVSGYADVIVSDGFSGNILLKSTEAVGKAAVSIVERIGKDADPDVIEAIKQKLLNTFDFNSRGAATFLGPKKIVVKMHGCANEDTTISSISQILRLEKAGFSNALASALKD